MGIDASAEAFLRHARGRGVDFARTCTLGRQELTIGGMTGLEPVFADRFFFEDLGAGTVHAVDYSDYQGAEIIHDLNNPEPPTVPQQYTAALDAGSLEHVFHVPNALRSLMSLVQLGGHLLFITPTDGHSGHGFYQFSPELFYRALSPENGFRIVECLYREIGRRGWYSVPDPASVGARVQIKARLSGQLHVIAERVSDVDPFQAAPLQSDYLPLWNSDGAGAPSRRRKLERIPPALHPFALRTKLALDVAGQVLASPRRRGLQRIELCA